MERLADLKVLAVTVTLLVAVSLWVLVKRKKVAPVALDREKKIALTLIRKTVTSHDTRLFRFALPSAEHTLGLPVGGFIGVTATIDGSLVVRPYTPITSDDELGYMELLIKVYTDGKMSSYLDSLSLGDHIMVRGPSGKIKYLGKGLFEVTKSRNAVTQILGKRVGMIAGGSGITPMLQFIREVLKRSDDPTELALLYSNKTCNDILCSDILKRMGSSGSFIVQHTLTQKPVPDDWRDCCRRIDRDMFSTHLPRPSHDTVILVCGPPGLVKASCPILTDMGHQEQNILLF